MTETFSTPSRSVDADTLASARRAAFRPVVVLLSVFLAVSAALIAFLFGLALAGISVDIAIWIRGSFVLASAITLLLFAVVARRGSRSAWLRLRIISAVVVVAVIVIVAIPGFLPGWVRIEQAVCGALVLGAIVLVNRRSMAALFPRSA